MPFFTLNIIFLCGREEEGLRRPFGGLNNSRLLTRSQAITREGEKETFQIEALFFTTAKLGKISSELKTGKGKKMKFLRMQI